jgi:enamine deaminase RidA (YjgF/YER057c/UK114 family)
MSEIAFYATPGYGEMFLSSRHYNQAVRVGDRVEISGQGGWDEDINFPESLEDEIVRAFENVERTLAAAGATWGDVISMNSYHVPLSADSMGDDHTTFMVEQLRKHMPDRGPIWTAVGVPVLAAPKMRVEIAVTAIVAAD